MPDFNLTPNVTARPAAVRGGSSNILLPVITADIAGNASRRLTGAVTGVIESSLQQRKELKLYERKEEQVFVTEAHNTISGVLNEFSNDFINNSDLKDYKGFVEKFDKKSEELIAEHSKNLSPYAQKVLKESMLVNKQLYFNKVNSYRRNKMEAAKKNALQATMTQAFENAVAITPEPGQEDLSFLQSNDAAYRMSKQFGGGDTRSSIIAYSKKSNQDLPEAFAEQSLNKSRIEVEKELKALTGAAKPDAELIAKKKTLLSAIDSAIISERAVQENIDKVLAGRFDRYVKTWDLASAENLIKNASAAGGGEFKASDNTLKKMNEVLVKYKGIAQIQQVNSVVSAKVFAGYNYRQNSPADLTIRETEAKQAIRKNIKNPKLQKQALINFDKQATEQKKLYEAAWLKDKHNILNYWGKNNFNQKQVDDYINELEPAYSVEKVGELRQMAKSYVGAEIMTSAGVEKQHQVTFDSAQAARDGYGYVGQQVFEIKNEQDFISYFQLKGGRLTPAKRAELSRLYSNKNMNVDAKILNNVLKKYEYKLDDFVKRGGAEAISRMLPAGKEAGYDETDKAVSKWLNEKISEDRMRNSTGLRSDLWGDAEYQYIDQEEMQRLYREEYVKFKADGVLPPWMKEKPTAGSLKRFAQTKGMKLDGDEYRLEVQDPYRFIAGYKKGAFK